MAKSPEAKITVKMFNDDFKKSSKELQAETSKLNRDFKLQQEQMKLTSSESEKLEAKLQYLTQKQDIARRSVEQAETAYEQAKQLFGENSDAAQQMAKNLTNAQIEEQKLVNQITQTNQSLEKQKLSTLDLKTEVSKLDSAFQLQQEQMKLTASETEQLESSIQYLTQKQDLMKRSIEQTESAYRQASESFGENSKVAQDLAQKLASVRVDEQKLANEIAKTNQKLAEQRGDADKTASKLDGLKRSLRQLKDASKDAAKELGSGLAAGSAAITAGVAGLTTGMADTNKDLSMLEVQIGKVGLVLDDISGARVAFDSVGQETDQVTEAMGNLIQAGYKTEEQITGISKAISGAIVSYGDTFTAEGLAESITTTTQLGEATGQLTDLLEKSGEPVDDFNKKMQSFSTTEERANYISQLLADQGLTASYEKYSDNNRAIAEASAAQIAFTDELNKLSETLTPLVTKVTEIITKIVEWANENPELVTTITIVAGVITTLVAVCMALAPIFVTLSGVAAALGVTIGTVAAPVLIVIGVITALIAIGVLLYQNWDTIVEKAGQLKDWLLEKWEQIKTTVTNKIKELIIAGMLKFTEFYTSTRDKFISIKNAITTYITEAKEKALNKVVELKDGFVNKATDIVNKARDKFNEVKKFITDPIEKAKDTVSGIVDDIKGFFDGLKLKIPDIDLPSLPKFTLETSSKTIMGKKITYPTGFDIKWNALGAVFTKPTIAGINNGVLQGFGEAGPEAALPLTEKVLGAIGKGIASTMNMGPQVIQLVTADSRVLAEWIADDVTEIQSFKENRALSFRK
ncbi:hypothetical protein [Lysinibacillus halotolerans]|uniref:Phage tail tape measure protein n=1 Tax=Lysinibacillus halotolerans TaxID=1368476 RepID=A0A3M8H1D0_9BACI|nr:hypothetical protein [Lysinibacillus halotolerans]RNC96265.1 hypothetical protein EC501_17080 [Lysinibacillus halotolerans]